MKDLYQDFPPEERIGTLEANCTSHEIENVERHFKPDEILQMKDEVSTISILRKDLQDELKKIRKQFKTKIDAHTASIEENLVNIKNGFIVKSEMVFLFADHDSGKMLTYDSEGIMIKSRKLKPSEKQTSIFTLKTGTNG